MELSCEHPYRPVGTPKTDFPSSTLFYHSKQYCESLLQDKVRCQCLSRYINVFDEYTWITFCCNFRLLFDACMSRHEKLIDNERQVLHQYAEKFKHLINCLWMYHSTSCYFESGNNPRKVRPNTRGYTQAPVVSKQQRHAIQQSVLKDKMAVVSTKHTPTNTG